MRSIPSNLKPESELALGRGIGSCRGARGGRKYGAGRVQRRVQVENTHDIGLASLQYWCFPVDWCPHGRIIQALSRLYPGSIQALSRLYPGSIQGPAQGPAQGSGGKLHHPRFIGLARVAILVLPVGLVPTWRNHPGSIHALSMLYPGSIQALSKLYPGSIQALSRRVAVPRGTARRLDRAWIEPG